MHPRSVGLRGGGASPQRCYVGVRLVLSAHNHVVVGWPTTSFGTLKLLPTEGGMAVGRAQGDTRGVAKCVGRSREENANKHRGCLLLAKGETTMGRASVVAKGRDANKHQGCLLLTMGGTAMGRANTHTHTQRKDTTDGMGKALLKMGVCAFHRVGSAAPSKKAPTHHPVYVSSTYRNHQILTLPGGLAPREIR